MDKNYVLSFLTFMVDLTFGKILPYGISHVGKLPFIAHEQKFLFLQMCR